MFATSERFSGVWIAKDPRSARWAQTNPTQRHGFNSPAGPAVLDHGNQLKLPPLGYRRETLGIPVEYQNGQQLETHTLSYGKNSGEARSGTPNQTRHNSRKLLWRTLSHGNSLGPAHEVEPRIRRAMTSWPRYNTAILHGVGGAQNANMQTQNANKDNGCARNKQPTRIDKQNKTHTLAPWDF